MKIAIDGPVGSGKSTAGLRLAKRLGFAYLDTGLMYRAAALASLGEEGRPAVIRRVNSVRIEAHADGAGPAIITLDGREAGHLLHSSGVEARVSYVSAIAEVRVRLVEAQRHFAGSGSVVMVGRDIGTTVLPCADLKVYLTASAETRAGRRYDEKVGKGEAVQYEDVLAGLRRRDDMDMGREESPLRPAGDARVLETDRMTLAQVVDSLAALVEEARR